MPITKSQFGDVQGGVNQLYAAQAAQEKAKLEAYLKGQQQQQNIGQAKDILGEYSGKGKKVSVGLTGEGGVTLSENQPDAMSKALTNSRLDVSKLDQAYRKELAPYEANMEAAKTIHELMDNPNQLNDSNTKAKLARMYEGQGQRLLQSLIEKAGGKPNLITKGEDFVNFLTGAVHTGLSPQQQNAIREEAITNGKISRDAWLSAYNQFKALAPVRAPTLGTMNPAQLEGAVNAYGSRGSEYSNYLDQREKNYRDQAGVGSGLNIDKSQDQFQKPQGLFEYLKGRITGKSSTLQPAAAPATNRRAKLEQLRALEKNKP